MLNHVTLLGRLAGDVDHQYTQTGIPWARFDLVVPIPSKDKDTPPDYFTIVCWRETADFAARYLGRGRQIVVEGRLTARRYVDKEGKNRKVVEVTANRLYFADSGSGGGNAGGYQASAPAAPAPAPQDTGFTQVDDDELPF